MVLCRRSLLLCVAVFLGYNNDLYNAKRLLLHYNRAAAASTKVAFGSCPQSGWTKIVGSVMQGTTAGIVYSRHLVKQENDLSQEDKRDLEDLAKSAQDKFSDFLILTETTFKPLKEYCEENLSAVVQMKTARAQTGDIVASGATNKAKLNDIVRAMNTHFKTLQRGFPRWQESVNKCEDEFKALGRKLRDVQRSVQDRQERIDDVQRKAQYAQIFGVLMILAAGGVVIIAAGIAAPGTGGASVHALAILSAMLSNSATYEIAIQQIEVFAAVVWNKIESNKLAQTQLDLSELICDLETVAARDIIKLQEVRAKGQHAMDSTETSMEEMDSRNPASVKYHMQEMIKNLSNILAEAAANLEITKKDEEALIQWKKDHSGSKGGDCTMQ